MEYKLQEQILGSGVYELRCLSRSLIDEAEIFINISVGKISANTELKKAVQNSVCELCMAILSVVRKDC